MQPTGIEINLDWIGFVAISLTVFVVVGYVGLGITSYIVAIWWEKRDKKWEEQYKKHTVEKNSNISHENIPDPSRSAKT